jgi:hypothetical protein
LRDGNDVKKFQLRRGAPVVHQVDEQQDQHEQRREHDQEADDHEDLVEDLASLTSDRICVARHLQRSVHLSRPAGSLRVSESPAMLKTSVISISVETGGEDGL